jgi:acyl carrier protein
MVNPVEHSRIKYSILHNIIAEVMEIPVSQINDESSPETVENWDSFRGLVLADELETKFNVKFNLDELINVKNVADIKKTLTKHGISLYE